MENIYQLHLYILWAKRGRESKPWKRTCHGCACLYFSLNYLSLSLAHWLVKKHPAPWVTCRMRHQKNWQNQQQEPNKSPLNIILLSPPFLASSRLFWKCLFFFLPQMLWRRCFWRRTLSKLSHQWPNDRWLGVRVVGIDGIHTFVFFFKGLGELVERNLAKLFHQMYTCRYVWAKPTSHSAMPKLSSSTWELLSKR